MDLGGLGLRADDRRVPGEPRRRLAAQAGVQLGHADRLDAEPPGLSPQEAAQRRVVGRRGDGILLGPLDEGAPVPFDALDQPHLDHHDPPLPGSGAGKPSDVRSRSPRPLIPRANVARRRCTSATAVPDRRSSGGLRPGPWTAAPSGLKRGNTPEVIMAPGTGSACSTTAGSTLSPGRGAGWRIAGSITGWACP